MRKAINFGSASVLLRLPVKCSSYPRILTKSANKRKRAYRAPWVWPTFSDENHGHHHQQQLTTSRTPDYVVVESWRLCPFVRRLLVPVGAGGAARPIPRSRTGIRRDSAMAGSAGSTPCREYNEVLLSSSTAKKSPHSFSGILSLGTPFRLFHCSKTPTASFELR